MPSLKAFAFRTYVQFVTKVDKHHIVLDLSTSDIQTRCNDILLLSSFGEFVSYSEVEPSRTGIGDTLSQVEQVS